MIFHPKFSEQREATFFLPLELQMEGGLSIIRIWLLTLIFGGMGELLHRALLVGFLSLKTLAFDNIPIFFETRGCGFPFAVDRCHVFGPYALEVRTCFLLPFGS